MAKEFDIFLDRPDANSCLREFDICLSKRLTECDILVYSIPYRDGITAMNRMVLESCLCAYMLEKFVAVQAGSSLVGRIDRMIKTCHERLGYGTGVDASARFLPYCIARPEMSAVGIDSGDIKLLAESFAAAEQSILLSAGQFGLSAEKFAGGGSSSIRTGAALQNIMKRCVEEAQGSILPSADAQTWSEKRLDADAALLPCCEIANLCYRITTTVNTAIEVSAIVLGTELHFSFGHAHNSVSLGAQVNDAAVRKLEAAGSVLGILSGAVESVLMFLQADAKGLCIEAYAQAAVKRYRSVGEMDDGALASFDNMALSDIDHIILS